MSTDTIVLIICSVLILGVIDIFIAFFKIRREIIFIIEYSNRLIEMRDKYITNKDYIEDVTFLITEKRKILSKISNNRDRAKLMKIIIRIEENWIYYIINEINTIDGVFLRKEKELKEKEKRTLTQLFNPFIWFYRGVERIMYITFGYLITKINANFDFENKTWRFINAIISFLGGLAGIWQVINIYINTIK